MSTKSLAQNAWRLWRNQQALMSSCLLPLRHTFLLQSHSRSTIPKDGWVSCWIFILKGSTSHKTHSKYTWTVFCCPTLVPQWWNSQWMRTQFSTHYPHKNLSKTCRWAVSCFRNKWLSRFCQPKKKRQVEAHGYENVELEAIHWWSLRDQVLNIQS